MRDGKAFVQNEKGSFLVSTLVFATMITVLVAGVWQYVTQKQSDWQKSRILNSRDSVMESALRISRTATYYYWTVLENAGFNNEFIDCMLFDDTAMNCKAKLGSGARKPYRVQLSDFDGTNYIPMIGRDTLNAVAYDFYGNRCGAFSLECPFKVFAGFVVKCPLDASDCNQADTIDMTVTVDVDPAFSGDLPPMAPMSVTQTIAIGNFIDYYNPVLPPNINCYPPDDTLDGTPITDGAGIGGWLVNTYNTYCLGPGPAPGPGPTPAPATPSPTPTPAATSACGTGYYIKMTAAGTPTCVPFKF